MLKIRLVVIICFLLPILSMATPIVQCINQAFLKPGFNMQNYQQCHALLQQCPKDGPVLNQDCVKKIAKKQKSCKQLRELANSINANVETIFAESTEKFTLIDQFFPADGQHNYYVISPKNCLINTKVDPRILNPNLKKQYKNVPLIIVNWDKPNFQKNSNGSSSYTALLRVTKNCLACEIAGWATVQFDFMKNGKLQKTSLLNFSKNKPGE